MIMVLSEEEDQLNKKHLDLCNKLNLDTCIIATSWDNFRSINKNFVLEGDALHWLGCSIFVASKGIESLMPSSMTKSNTVNLISLLRHSNLSYVDGYGAARAGGLTDVLEKNFRIDVLEATLGAMYWNELNYLRGSFGHDCTVRYVE